MSSTPETAHALAHLGSSASQNPLFFSGFPNLVQCMSHIPLFLSTSSSSSFFFFLFILITIQIHDINFVVMNKQEELVCSSEQQQKQYTMPLAVYIIAFFPTRKWVLGTLEISWPGVSSQEKRGNAHISFWEKLLSSQM